MRHLDEVVRNSEVWVRSREPLRDTLSAASIADAVLVSATGDPFFADRRAGLDTAQILVQWCVEYGTEAPGSEQEFSPPALNELLELARGYATVRRLMDGLVAGDATFHSRDTSIFVKSQRSWTLEALDVALEVGAQVPAAINESLVGRQALSWLSTGSYDSAGNAPALVAEWLTLQCRREVERYPLTMDPSTRLTPQLTIGDAWSLYPRVAALSRATWHSLRFGHLEAPLTVIDRSGLQSWLGAERKATWVIDAFIDFMTHDITARHDARTAPLLPAANGGFLITHLLVDPSNLEVNLLRRAAQTSKSFGRTGDLVGRRGVDDWVSRLAALPDVEVLREVKLKRSDNSDGGDLDVVALDRHRGVGMVVEVKSQLPAATVREGLKLDEVMEKAAVAQDRRSAELARGALSARLPRHWPAFDAVDWTWVVGTPRQLPSRITEALDLVGWLTLRLIDRVRPVSLADLCDLAMDLPVPEPERDFNVGLAEVDLSIYSVLVETLVWATDPNQGWEGLPAVQEASD